MAAFFTAAYSVRLVYLTFFVKVNGVRKVYELAEEPDHYILLPLLSLYVGTIFTGFFFKDMFIGLGTDFWLNSILILPRDVALFDGEFITWWIKLLPFFFSFGGIIFSVCMSYSKQVRSIFFESIIWADALRDFCNFLIWYDYFICNVFMPYFLVKYVSIVCIKIMESTFMVLILNFRLVILKYFLEPLQKFHNGVLIFYCSFFFLGLCIYLVFLVMASILCPFGGYNLII